MRKTRARTSDTVRRISDPLRYLPADVIARGPTEAEHAAAVRIRDGQLLCLAFYRAIADEAGLHRSCPRAACKRRRGCAAEEPVCFLEALPKLDPAILAPIREALAARKLDYDRPHRGAAEREREAIA